MHVWDDKDGCQSPAGDMAQGSGVTPVSASFLLGFLPIMSTPMAPYPCISPDAVPDCCLRCVPKTALPHSARKFSQTSALDFEAQILVHYQLSE